MSALGRHRKPLCCRNLLQRQYSPVFRVCGEKVGLYESKGGHSIAQYVGTPHQGDPVVEDDGGRKPVEIVGIGKPQSMSDEPTLQPIDLILVNQACSSEWRDNTGIWLLRDTIYTPV